MDFQKELKETTDAYLDSFQKLTIEQLNWKPNPKTWSIAQNIDHIITLNETYFNPISELAADRYKIPFTSRIGFVVAYLEKALVKSVQPGNTRKTKTFSIWEPDSSSIAEGILDRFKNHQRKVSELISNSSVLLEERKLISSPANKYIVYHLEVAFEIIVTHEKRHLDQARNVLKLQT